MTASEIFATNLRQFRVMAGITQKELADMIGIDKTAISLWETQKSNPSLFNIENAAIALGVPITRLLDKDIAELIKKGALKYDVRQEKKRRIYEQSYTDRQTGK